MKKFILIASIIMLLGAGCAAKTTLKVNGNSINLDDLEKKVAETKQAPVNDCPIKLASGEPIFNNVDAAAVFGGKWTREIKINQSPAGGCIYSLYEEYEKGKLPGENTHSVYIHAIEKNSFDRVNNEKNIKPPESVETEINGEKVKIRVPVPTYKDIVGVGDQALLVILDGKTANPMLYLKKGNNYIVITPSPATEEQAVSIAKTIVSKWK